MKSTHVPRETPPALLEQVVALPVYSIDVGPNVRVDAGDLEGLAESIRHLGVLQPIRVRERLDKPGSYVLLWGQRRLLAARKAELEFIPAVVDAYSDDPLPEQLAIEQLVENLQRQDLNPLEEATALRQVLDADPKCTHEQLAQELGRSRPWVSNTLRLLEAAEPVQAALRAGEISASHARAMIGLGDEDMVEVLAAAKRGEPAKYVERMAEDRRKSMDGRAAQREQERAVAAQVLEATQARGMKPGATLVRTSGPQLVRDAVAAAGFIVRDYGDGGPEFHVLYGNWPACCNAFNVHAWHGKVEINHACVDPAHKEAREAASRAEVQRDRADRELRVQAQRQRNTTFVSEVQPRLEAQLAPASPGQGRALRLVLAALLERVADEDFITRHLGPEPDDGWEEGSDPLWDACVKCPEAQLGAELAALVAQSLAGDDYTDPLQAAAVHLVVADAG